MALEATERERLARNVARKLYLRGRVSPQYVLLRRVTDWCNAPDQPAREALLDIAGDDEAPFDVVQSKLGLVFITLTDSDAGIDCFRTDEDDSDGN